jgi:hypothetical protein
MTLGVKYGQHPQVVQLTAPEAASSALAKGTIPKIKWATIHLIRWKGAIANFPVLAEIGHSQIQNRPQRSSATKPNNAWWRCAKSGQCNPPVAICLLRPC